MTKPKCPECGKNEFKFYHVEPRKGFKPSSEAYLIYCDNCGTIVGSGVKSTRF